MSRGVRSGWQALEEPHMTTASQLDGPIRSRSTFAASPRRPFVAHNARDASALELQHSTPVRDRPKISRKKPVPIGLRVGLIVSAS